MPHLISATLTDKAYEVYCKWKTKREASAKISLAMVELAGIQELNEALSTQLNIHKARWKWLNKNLQREMDFKECNAEEILHLACQHDHLYYRREE
jgi:hypothetical protein